MNRKVIAGLLSVLYLICMSQVANSTTIDFENIPSGVYGHLDFGDMVMDSDQFLIDVLPSGPANEGNALFLFSAPGLFMTFTNNYINSFSIGFGVDMNYTDYAELYMNVFEIDGNSYSEYYLCDFVSNTSTYVGGDFLSVSSDTGIEAVVFKIATPGAFVYLDNITYETASPVPEPATMLLLGTGIAGLAGYRKRAAIKQ